MNRFDYVANVALEVEGRPVAAGETFSAPSARYGYFIVTGKARLASTPPTKPSRPRRRGTYRRRDLRAEP